MSYDIDRGQLSKFTARSLATQAGCCILVLDEVQKLPNWTEEIKRLRGDDTKLGLDVRTVTLWSAPLLFSRELTESMAGCFEITRLGHWQNNDQQGRSATDVSAKTSPRNTSVRSSLSLK
jgi:hypothetical protein